MDQRPVDENVGSGTWVRAHFALVIPTRVAGLQTPDGWVPGAYAGSEHPFTDDLNGQDIGGSGDATEWFPGRLATATANNPASELSVRSHIDVYDRNYVRDNVRILALELVTFAPIGAGRSNDSVIVHVSVDEPSDGQLLAISQNLRRPGVNAFGDSDDLAFHDPMRLVIRAIRVELHEPLEATVVEIGASGRVRFAPQFREHNPVTDRAPLTVSVAAVARKCPDVAPLPVEYLDPEWTAPRLWAYALAYGLAPGMQWPGDTAVEIREVMVECPKDWTGVVTEIGQAFVCVDPSPADTRFRGFWNLAQTRFVDLLVLCTRQTSMLEALSEELVQLGRNAFEKARQFDSMSLSGVRQLRYEVDDFVRRYAEFRNDHWFTIIPRRNRATAILQQLQSRLYTKQLLDGIDAEVERLSAIIRVAADERQEAHEKGIRERIEARNRMVELESRKQDHERAKRDWLISVVSALVGLPSITYALAAITTPPGVENAAWWSMAWVILTVPVTLGIHRLITRADPSTGPD